MKTRLLLLFPLYALATMSCASAAPLASSGASSSRLEPVQEQSLESVFSRVQSSVVTIQTVAAGGRITRDGEVTTALGLGSGVLIDRSGKILTASHVVHSADRLEVEFLDGTVCRAHVVGSVRAADVALVQLDDPVPDGVVAAKVGDSDDVRVASQAFVIGAPLGITHTLTVGHISARRQEKSPVRALVQPEFFQTDAAINKGNSGGPMFNMKGEVIGIVSHIISKSGGDEGLGFAVTSNVCRELLIDRNPMWSGMDEIMLGGEYARAFNLPDGQGGLLVQRVAKDSPAERLGLQGGSIVAEIDGKQVLLGGDVILAAFGFRVDEVASARQIMEKVDDLKPADEIRLTVLRGGKKLELADTLANLTRRAPVEAAGKR